MPANRIHPKKPAQICVPFVAGPTWRRPGRNEPVTIARLERALAVISYCILRDGDVYAPYFHRLEREIAAMRASEDTVSRARRYLEAHAGRLPAEPPTC
jgi:hypothetical protein